MSPLSDEHCVEHRHLVAIAAALPLRRSTVRRALVIDGGAPRAAS